MCNVIAQEEVEITNSGLPPEHSSKLKAEMPDQVFTSRTLGTYFYEINNTKAPFNDLRVRKALNLALDRNIITDKVLGQGQMPTYVFTPTYIAEGGAIQQPEYTFKLSMKERNQHQLLKEAGFSKSNPLKFTILYNTNEKIIKKLLLPRHQFWKNTGGLVDVKTGKSRMENVY